MPLTLLAFRLNAVNAVMPGKTCVYKKSDFLTPWRETNGQSFSWQRITKLLEHISSKVWENCRRLEFGPERGNIGSVIELAMAKQVYQKIDDFTTWLVGVLQKFWQFWQF